ncbi:MAG: DMT family transporter [Pseudomonadota bacterium]
MTAFLAMLGACALLAGTTLLAKLLGGGPEGLGLHPLQISAGRFIFAWAAVAAVAVVSRPEFAGASWPTHTLRAVCGWLSASCLFAAAAQMPLASATALSFLSPLVTMVCAIAFLGERVGKWRWIAASVALGGALVLIGPGGETFQLAAFIALAAALFMGIEGMFIKRLSDTEPPIRILLVNNSIGMVISVAAAALVWQWPEPLGWGLLIALGGTMIIAQALLIQAMKRGDASLLVPLYYTTLLFAAGLDFSLFGTVPTLTASLGAGLIVLGALIITLRGRSTA